MKTFLLPIEDSPRADGMLALASAYAAAFDATIDAVALRFPQYQAVGAEPIVAVAIPPIEEDEREALTKARARFDGFVRTNPEAASRLRWRGGDPVDDQALGALGRVYDLTIIARPGGAGVTDGARMTTLEAALFESGRPILIAPPNDPPGTVAKHVVVAWNQSTEAAQTMTAAMPILHKAEDVTIVTIAGSTVPGPDGDQLKDHLAAHGIRATHIVDRNSRNRGGSAILEKARSVNCDLLIKSAYTQSRLRQMIFGGATSHILANADMPVFMAN